MKLLCFFIGLLLLLCLLDITNGSKNKVEDEIDDDDDDDDDDDGADSKEEEIQTDRQRKRARNNKNRRIFGDKRSNGNVRLRGPMRPPIFLLPPPSPVFVKTNPTSGVSVRSFGQPLASAQAVNPGFSISNVRSAVAHNTVGATPNTFVVTPQVTSFQGTPIPSIPLNSQVSVIHLPAGQNQLQIQPQNQAQPKIIVQTKPFQQPMQIQTQIPPQPTQQVIHALPKLQAQPLVQNPVIISSPPPPIVDNSLDVVSPPVAPPPPSPYISALADDIRCMRQPDTLTALLTAPAGYTAPPFFNARPDIDAQSSVNCRIVLSAGSSVYRLDISELDECGVSSQAEDDGKEWLSISIRFPLVSGLKTPDDEVITLKCKPQDRTLSANHAVDFHGNLVSSPATSRSSVFLGQERDLQCDLGLFRKAPGSSDYTHRVNAGSAIELGQELKLRAAVKPGDGWNYVRLTDVIVYRVPASFNTKSKVQLLEASKRKHILNTHNGFEPETTVEYAHLVLTDGCRNSAYKAIAPNHPEVDLSNTLTVDFNFKAFMFQTMTEGEAVRITARVTACVEQDDCSITHCPDGFFSHGRKRRQTSTLDNTTTISNTTEFDRNLTVVVLTANNREDEWYQREYLLHQFEKENACPQLLISTVALAVALGITLFVGLCTIVFNVFKNRYLNNMRHESNNDQTVKSFSNYKSRINHNNVDSDVSNNPKTTEMRSGVDLKRSDSVLRSLQTFLAASLLQSFGRNNDENRYASTNLNSTNLNSTNLNSFGPRLNDKSTFNNKKSDELFIAIV